MKNHHIFNGQLLQTNKKFQQLKESQKTFIHERLIFQFQRLMNPDDYLASRQNEILINAVYEDLKERQIWLPYSELEKYFRAKKIKIQRASLKRR